MSADRNLLFGVLALQNNFVTRDQLVEAMNAWGISRARPLGELLRERGALAEEEHALIEGLVQRQLRRHQGDVERSLRDLEVSSSARRALAAVADDEVQASLFHLATPSAEATTDHVSRPGGEGLRYRVLRPHARGGLGEVFVAEDTELHREVALKEIQPERAGDPGSRGRFLLEAEVTGRLEHPGIVPVYGLGCYQDGRPFYAMRFVKGDNLKHAIERFHQSKEGFDGLAFRQVLRRFLDVCNAVAYAHSRGVLHRDLKPGNVMLGEFGETLLVDWGLAKVVGRADPKGGEATLRLSSGSGVAQTVAGSAVGTPAYMSPEQAEGKLEALGPATDVYSLGATLYCLLTGRAPVSDGPVAEVLERVRRGDVSPAETVKAGAPRPLSAICRKAMALRPADRYPAAKALAEDVEQWLADEPVSTYPDPVLVRARRWARKHRTAVATLAAALGVALVGLAVGLVVVGGLNRRLDTANAELSDSNTRLEAALGEVESKQKETERERNVAVAVSEFLQRDLLGQADIANQMLVGGEEGRNPDIKVAELLDRAAKAIDGKFPGQEETEAAIRWTIGDAYLAMGRYGEALPQLQRSVETFEKKLGVDHSHTLNSKNSLAALYRAQGCYDKAGPLALEVLQQYEKTLGGDHIDTLTSKNNLAELFRAQARYDKAEPLFLEVVRLSAGNLGPNHFRTLASKNNLALVYSAQGKYDKAEALFLEVAGRSERALGADHPFALMSKDNLAGLYREQGRMDKAEPLQLDVVKLRERKLGSDHHHTLQSKNNLALLYRHQAKYKQAESLYLEVVRLNEKGVGADHPDTLTSKNNLAGLYRDQRRNDKAEPLLLEVVRQSEKKLGADHSLTMVCKGNLASLYWSMRRLDRSVPLFEQLLPHFEKKLGADHPETLLALANLGVNYRDAGRAEDAIRCLKDALAKAGKRPGGFPANLTFAHRELALAYVAAKQYHKAEPFHRSQLEQASKRFGPDDPRTAGAMAQLGTNLLLQKKHVEVEKLLRDSLHIREKVQPDEWTTFNTKSMLGESLLGQKKPAEAEPLLVQGYEGMKQSEAKIPQPFRTVRLKEALERLVALYDATGKKDDAAKYRKELEALAGANKDKPKK